MSPTRGSEVQGAIFVFFDRHLWQNDPTSARRRGYLQVESGSVAPPSSVVFKVYVFSQDIIRPTHIATVGSRRVPRLERRHENIVVTDGHPIRMSGRKFGKVKWQDIFGLLLPVEGMKLRKVIAQVTKIRLMRGQNALTAYVVREVYDETCSLWFDRSRDHRVLKGATYDALCQQRAKK